MRFGEEDGGGHSGHALLEEPGRGPLHGSGLCGTARPQVWAWVFGSVCALSVAGLWRDTGRGEEAPAGTPAAAAPLVRVHPSLALPSAAIPPFSSYTSFLALT